MLKLFS